ncbi:unnamed protein product [Nippostrongylus brasiliensis]|uniref:Uncharacterized protein n=1 Tax=Nippostrongylus brasiliensis TaxID=27835 RepID=A0A0N4XQK5_NIPBR|nr:unnamed protein product [Nippostrongylus brasiliensis]
MRRELSPQRTVENAGLPFLDRLRTITNDAGLIPWSMDIHVVGASRHTIYNLHLVLWQDMSLHAFPCPPGYSEPCVVIAGPGARHKADLATPCEPHAHCLYECGP